MKDGLKLSAFVKLAVLAILVLLCESGTCVPSASALAHDSPRPTFELTIHPVPSGTEVTSVDVREKIEHVLVPSGHVLALRAPITYASVTGIADSMENLDVRDAQGVVPLRRQDDPPDSGGFPFYRHWAAQRPVLSPIFVSYRVRPRVTGYMGPQFALQSYGGGISSAGSGFLILPEDLGVNFGVRVVWDLSGMAPGSFGVTTFGEGPFTLRGSPEQLMEGYFMAGPLGRYPQRGTVKGFSGYWLGLPPFDPVQELAWVSRCYRYLRSFFRDTGASSYRVFIRVLPGVSGTPGTALLNSFMLGAPPRSSHPLGPAPRESITHEMVHHWALGLQGDPGAIAWFHEGIATFYMRLLPMRAGLISVESYRQSISSTAEAYFTNPYRNAPLDELAHLGFSTGVGPGSAQNVAYTRGSLYLADLDARIRDASRGRRKLDDLLLPLFARIRSGEKVNQDTWVDVITKALGPSARAEFESVIVKGETIEPVSGAFGPCFERRPTKFQSQGKSVDGFEWVRIPTVADEVCRQW